VRRARLLLAAAAVAAAAVYLVIGGLRGAVVYYLTPSELLDRGPAALGRTLRVGGQVQPGSRVWDPQTLQLRFVLTDGRAAVPVVFRGVPPELFTEGQGAVVEGVYGPDGVLTARSVMVKHSEQYAPPSP
jgi:cytochrome c-type biogenesis protein CcmE